MLFEVCPLDNPDNTGIDTKKDLIFFVKDSIGGYIAFEGTIKDENMFKKFLGNMSQGAKETEKTEWKLMTIQQVTASWKDGRIVVAVIHHSLTRPRHLAWPGAADPISTTAR